MSETINIFLLIVLSYVSGAVSFDFIDNEKGNFETLPNAVLCVSTVGFFGGIVLGLVRLASYWF